MTVQDKGCLLYTSVPVRLTEHGQAEGREVFIGKRGVDAFRHNGLLLFGSLAVVGVVDVYKRQVWYRNGSTWQQCTVWYRSGGSWVQVVPYYCNGGTWVRV